MRLIMTLVAAAVLAAAGAPAWGQDGDAIRELRVEGNQRIEDATVASYMEVGVGDRFDPASINRSLKSLFDTGLFADVAIGRDGDALVVQVVENPVINRLAFEGNERIDDEALEGEVQLRPRTVYTRTRVQTDAARLLEVYRRSGRFAATVEPQVVQLEQNRVDLIFNIDEGPLTNVENIVFVGNVNFSDGALRDVIQTQEARWWRFFSTTDTYDGDRLSFDRELLRRFYLEEGFADFRVVSAVAELTPDGSAFHIAFVVSEGERYRFGAVDVVSEFPGLDAETLKPLVTTDEGDWYNGEEVEETVLELTNEADSLGFAFVQVEPQVTRSREERTIAIVYRVAEGPRLYVKRIDITGNVRTLDRVIRRNVRLAEGDAFNAAKLRRSRTLIQNLRFFSRVDIEDSPGDGPDEAHIAIDVEEEPTGEITFGGGYSSNDGPSGQVAVRERNLLGRGQDLALEFLISGVSQNIDLSFTEPYFLNRDFAAGFDVFNRVREFRNSNFDREDIGLALRGSYPLSEYLRHSVGYTIKQEEVAPYAGASRFVTAQGGERLISQIDQSLFYDRRETDALGAPRGGYFLRYSTGFTGLVGDREWLRQIVSGGYYLPFWDEWVASAVGEAGYIFSYSDDPVEIADRFFLGGNSFRGFDVAGIGPRDTDDDTALGGNMLYKGTVEVEFPFGLPTELGIKGRVFSIVGSVGEIDIEGDSAGSVVDSGSLRASAGFGVSWGSPFGPIRIDFATALRKENYDDTETLSIGFGAVF